MDDHPGSFVADGQGLIQTPPPIAFITAGEMFAVTTGLSAVPIALAVLRSAPANSSPWSEGLRGGSVDADDHLLRFWLRGGDADER